MDTNKIIIISIALLLGFETSMLVHADGIISLSQTGQSICYDTLGNVIFCEGTGQDGEIQAGIAWPDPRFTSGLGTESDCITDNLTGLMWTKNGNLAGQNNWYNAIAFANNLTMCGYTDWRLPNVIELESLLNADEQNNAIWLNTQGFYNVQPYYFYWSSTTRANDTNYAWFVSMGNGNVLVGLKIYEGYVWPVRSGTLGLVNLPQTGQKTSYYTGDNGDLDWGIELPAPRFSDNGSGSVTDNLTGLVWLKKANCINTNYQGFDNDFTYGDGRVTWQHALDFVMGINNGTYPNCGDIYTDWRLPNRKELRSLIDHSEYAPALMTGYPFTDVQLNYYWTSTSHSPTYAWKVSMWGGYVSDSSDKGDQMYVWPVRSFSLTFPLNGFNPYTAPISSVFDHSMSSPYNEDGVVTAYTGEIGDYQNYSPSCDCYNKIDGSAFYINDNYVGARSCGGANYLCYDGHPGVDYAVVNNTPVYASADGVGHIPTSFPGVSNAQLYNTIEIEHKYGYSTYYLHLSSQLIQEGQPVTKGTLIGYSGDVGSPGAYHLHFEVQKDGIPVDPYGYTGLDILWGSSPIRAVGTTDSYYLSLQAAYNDTADNSAIQSQFMIFTEDLIIDRNITLTLDGGYDSNFIANSSPSIINGNLTISDGRITIGNFTIK